MQVVLIILQVLHVLSGVFWAGTTFALARMGGNQAGQLFRPQMGAAVFAVVTGGLLWFLLHRGPPGLQEHILGVGAIFALIAAGIQGLTGPRRQHIVAGIGALESASADQRMVTGQRLAAACLAVTVACMAASRYVF
jgi:hypothetical protein